LRARLAALPADDFKDPLGDLDTLLTHAAQAGATGARLADFAERLRSEMEYQRTVRLSDEDAIQLITAHKAKGLEWDAVIVPFLGRQIREPSPTFPSLIRVPGSDQILAALHKEDREAEIKDAYKRLRRQEMERLLYVALTRARHTLVLALDRSLFSPKTDRAADYSQLKFLRGDHGESSIQILDALPDAPNACPETSASWEEHRAEGGDTVTSELPPRSVDTLSRARARATEFIRKQNPSGYEESVELPGKESGRPPQRPLHSLADNAATLYGSWWHTLFQHFPWTGDMQQWQTAFAALQPSSTDPTRSAREWKLFVNASPTSSLAKFLARKSIVTHTEFPCLWRINDASCLEGMIDLLLVDPGENRCLLVDWKTNRATPAEAERLRERYRPQIAAYWKAVREITKLEVEAGIFATALGQFLPYDADELEAEWKRLQALPPDRLSAEIARV